MTYKVYIKKDNKKIPYKDITGKIILFKNKNRINTNYYIQSLKRRGYKIILEENKK